MNSIESFYFNWEVVYFLASTSGPSTLSCSYRYGPYEIPKGSALAQYKSSVGQGPKGPQPTEGPLGDPRVPVRASPPMGAASVTGRYWYLPVTTGM